MNDYEGFHSFIAWANDKGYDTAHTYDTDRSKWVALNPMTADLWEAWQASRAQGAAPTGASVREALRASRENYERNFGPSVAADWVYSDLAELVADPLDEQAPMELRLCESERLVLRANRNYVFTIDPDCESCVRIGKAYTDPLPDSLPVGAAPSNAEGPKPDGRDEELMRDSLEIISQLMACHDEPACPAISVGSWVAERLIERLSRFPAPPSSSQEGANP